MNYGLLHVIHLLCAFVFIGAVFFEVLILEGVRKRVPASFMATLEQNIMHRARRLMPPVVITLFAAGIAMALQHYSGLTSPWQSSFSTLLTVKIALAISVAGHFVTAITCSLRGRMTSKLFRFIHFSVFSHMLLIILLAKGMFYISW